MRIERKRSARDSLIDQPYNPDDERFARLLDSQYRAGHKAGWNECVAHLTEAGRRALESRHAD